MPLSDLISRVREELGDEPWQDYLTTQVLSTDTSMAVNQPTQWAEGDIAEFSDESGEEVRVLATPTVNPVSIKRKHDSSYQVAHANGVYINKNPNYGYNEITLAINRTLHRMWPWAWSKRNFTVTPSTTASYFAVPADFIDLIAVTQPLAGTPTRYLKYGEKNSNYSVSIEDNLGDANFGGKAVGFPRGFQDPNNTVTVTYRSYLDLDDVEDGLAADTLVMGTVERMLARRQAQRSGQDLRQGEPGMPTVFLQDVSYYRQSFEENLRKLYIYLLSTIPPMRTWG